MTSVSSHNKMLIQATVKELFTMCNHATRNKWPSGTEDMALKKKTIMSFQICLGSSDLTKVLIMMDELFFLLVCYKTLGVFHGQRSVHQRGSE